ncbi:AAA domain-containing protein [Pseudovibrio brasiliensis]|uniref:NERD domain-containing protein n=1 Tax=Pseudovibrio brasiliensis TaxID=1898042 RepID=A0ABX8AIH2_9HYPH|nr:AAA domain-containing protein [Pseudovibrio brasiliensis]QUS54600.1 NERD domain-containing protein [Pseudovibrio brasiliensis]
MKVDIRSPQGIHAAELKAIKELGEGLRNSWFGYASFLIADKAGTMEIDLLVFTHNRILLVEVKHWNGSIKSDGKTWVQTTPSGANREQASPVVIKREHAQRLRSLFKKHLESRWNGFYVIETCVVLSGDAKIAQMPDWERELVFTLDEFLEIKSADGFERLLPERNTERPFQSGKLLRPNASKQIDIFEKWLSGGGCIKPREREAGGYVVCNPTPLFSHPKHIYEEFEGAHRSIASNTAMLRAWDFNRLGAHAFTQEQRALLGLREQRAIAYVSDNDYQLRRDYLMQPQHQLVEDEVLEDLIEVYEKPRLYERLDIHLSQLSHDKDSRYALLRALLAPFADLHKIGLAHRDITLERLYYNGQSQSITVSGLVASRFPDPQGKSVGDVRSFLSSSSIPLPEDVYGLADIDACRIDVFMLGVAAYRIAYNQSLIVSEDGVEWTSPTKDPFEGALDNWIKQAINISPAERQQDAAEMLRQLTEITSYGYREKVKDTSDVIKSLQAHRSQVNLMMEYPPSGEVRQDHERNRMVYRSTYKGRPVTVRCWPSLGSKVDDPGLNRRLLQFCERCQTMRQHSLPVASVIDFGFSMMGTYVVQDYVEGGEKLSDWLQTKAELEFEDFIVVSKSLVSAVNQLHLLDISHGDLKPDNILVIKAEGSYKICLIDTIDIDHTAKPLHNMEYAPQHDVSSLERDRFAVYIIVDEIFAGQGGKARLVREEIQNGIGDDSEDVPVSLEPLRESLSLATKPDPDPIKSLTISWPDLGGHLEPVQLKNDRGYIYVSSRKDQDVLFLYLTSLEKKITCKISLFDLQLLDVWMKDIAPAEFVRDAQNANNPKNKKSQSVQLSIGIDGSRRNATAEAELLAFFCSLEIVQDFLQSPKDVGEQAVIEVDDKEVPLENLWDAVVEAERELHPTVTVAGYPKNEDGICKLQVHEDLSSFEQFDESDKVQILSSSNDGAWYYGILDIKNSREDRITISEPRAMSSLRPGTKLRLVELRAETSWQRRRKGLHAVLQGDTPIPSLVDWFSPSRPNPVPAIAPLPQPSVPQIEQYGLDESKVLAFRHVLEQPLSVVMGPPGTGKTMLLSALLDYLTRLKEVGRVLLVSQSHVAVNELATRARHVMSKRSERDEEHTADDTPSMVRLGDRKKVDDELLDVHVDALQARYRTSFHRDFDARLMVLAPRLGLPEEIVLEAADIYRRIGKELYSYVDHREQLRKYENSEGASENLEYTSRLNDKVRRLYDMLCDAIQVYIDNPYALLEDEDPLLDLLNNLGDKYHINNPKAISCLRDVIDISHKWLLRLSSDAEGFAGFAARTRSLVIGTLVGIGKSSYNLSQNNYDVAIIDEAGRATASELAMAMQSANRVILVGDHKQLPPMNDDALVRRICHQLSLPEEEVLRTDFERAFTSTKGVMLDTQYRMAPAIGDLVSHVFYEGNLKTGRGDAPEWMKQLPSPWNRTVTWLDTSEFQEENTKREAPSGMVSAMPDKLEGASNIGEVELICQALKVLVEDASTLEQLHVWAAEDKAPPIGIITGYRKQVAAIQERLDTDAWAAGIRSLLRVDTIDSYQGSENRIVILSLVRNNRQNKIGFIKEAPRVNVAISRARERLLFVGAANMWQGTHTDTPLGRIRSYLIKAIEQNHEHYQFLQASQLIECTASDLSFLGSEV